MRKLKKNSEFLFSFRFNLRTQICFLLSTVSLGRDKGLPCRDGLPTFFQWPPMNEKSGAWGKKGGGGGGCVCVCSGGGGG